MNLRSNFIGNRWLIVILFFVFLKNIGFDYFSHFHKIGAGSIDVQGAYKLVQFLPEVVLFWFLFRNDLRHPQKFLLLPVVQLLVIALPYYLSKPLFWADLENYVLKYILFSIPFFLYVYLVGERKLSYVPLLMGFIPWLRFDIADNFIANDSFVQKAFVLIGSPVVVQSTHFSLSLSLAFIHAVAYVGLILLFEELTHQLFSIRSFRFAIQLPLSKKNLLVVFLIYKSLIYWLIADLVIVALGTNSFPVYSNKAGLLLHGIGVVAALLMCMIFFRKYMVLYFYEKINVKNWVFVMFFVPFLDVLALLFTLVMPSHLVHRLMWRRFSLKTLVLVLGVFFVISAIFFYFTLLKNLPASEKELRVVLLILYVGIPALSLVFIVMSRWSANLYLWMLMAYLVGYLILVRKGVSVLEASKDIHLAVGTVSRYLHTGLFFFFLYPIIHFRKYLKLKE